MQLLYSIIMVLALMIGFYFGFVIGRTNELPKIKSKKQIVKEKEEERQKNLFERALNNLDKYNGTSEGQEEIV